MANDLNQCQFIGRLGRDPEIKYMPNGDPVANLSLACDWKGKDKEGTEWVRIVAFGKLAEIMGKYLRKGSQVFIQGSLRTRKWLPAACNAQVRHWIAVRHVLDVRVFPEPANELALVEVVCHFSLLVEFMTARC